jgi:hypothetical protein
MEDPNITYWRGVVRAAEGDLEAARFKSEVNEAARRLRRAKAELKRG